MEQLKDAAFTKLRDCCLQDGEIKVSQWFCLGDNGKLGESRLSSKSEPLQQELPR